MELVMVVFAGIGFAVVVGVPIGLATFWVTDMFTKCTERNLSEKNLGK